MDEESKQAQVTNIVDHMPDGQCKEARKDSIVGKQGVGTEDKSKVVRFHNEDARGDSQDNITRKPPSYNMQQPLILIDEEGSPMAPWKTKEADEKGPKAQGRLGEARDFDPLGVQLMSPTYPSSPMFGTECSSHGSAEPTPASGKVHRYKSNGDSKLSLSSLSSPSNLKRFASRTVRGLSRGGSLGSFVVPEEYQNLMKAAVFQVKLTGGLNPPLKTPVVVSIPKSSTVQTFYIAALGKYQQRLRSQGQDLHAQPHQCAVCNTGEDNPLQLDRDEVLRDALIRQAVPYPFALHLIYDPEYVRRREEERAEKEARQLAEQRRQELLAWLEHELLSTPRREQEGREALHRAWLVELEAAAGRVLDIVCVDFREIIALQQFKEKQEAIDRESDQEFFRQWHKAKLQRLSEAEAKKRQEQADHRAEQDRLLRHATRQLARIRFVEGRAWEQLSVLSAENWARAGLTVEQYLHFELMMLDCAETWERDRTARVETEGYRRWYSGEQRERFDIEVAARVAQEYARRPRHQQKLKTILAALPQGGAGGGRGRGDRDMDCSKTAQGPALPELQRLQRPVVEGRLLPSMTEGSPCRRASARRPPMPAAESRPERLSSLARSLGDLEYRLSKGAKEGDPPLARGPSVHQSCDSLPRLPARASLAGPADQQMSHSHVTWPATVLGRTPSEAHHSLSAALGLGSPLGQMRVYNPLTNQPLAAFPTR
mmetsp:Transcript_78052/g.137728  ORF Transcript_78052/g.137728 Transcript_78052/m.137728 type:complete len:714 (-) Transcript_78052:824-2965(-)